MANVTNISQTTWGISKPSAASAGYGVYEVPVTYNALAFSYIAIGYIWDTVTSSFQPQAGVITVKTLETPWFDPARDVVLVTADTLVSFPSDASVGEYASLLNWLNTNAILCHDLHYTTWRVDIGGGFDHAEYGRYLVEGKILELNGSSVTDAELRSLDVGYEYAPEVGLIPKTRCIVINETTTVNPAANESVTFIISGGEDASNAALSYWLQRVADRLSALSITYNNRVLAVLGNGEEVQLVCEGSKAATDIRIDTDIRANITCNDASSGLTAGVFVGKCAGKKFPADIFISTTGGNQNG